MFNMPPRDKHKKRAYENGWSVASYGGLRHTRPAYHSHQEREAFDKGWADCADLIAMGYRAHSEHSEA